MPIPHSAIVWHYEQHGLRGQFRISGTVSRGGSPGRLVLEAIAEQEDDRDQFDEFLALIRVMDRAWLELMRRDTEVEDQVLSERPMTPELFDAVFGVAQGNG